MKKWVIIGICMLIVSALVWGSIYLSRTAQYRRIISEITIPSIDLSTISDGVYEGSFDAIMVAAEVNVQIEDHRITDIVLVSHKNDRGAPAVVIIGKIVDMQSLNVDTISGATNSSKVILKAIENALESALEEVHESTNP